MSSTLLSINWKLVGFLDGQIGALAAGFSFAAILGRIPLGSGLERWGRRPFLIVGSIMLTLLPASYSYLGASYEGWVAVRLLQGAGLGCYLTTILTWVADISPTEDIGRLQGVFGVSGLVGSAVGPYVAEFVYLKHGFNAMFSVMAAEGVLCCLLVATLPESRKTGKSKNKTRAPVSEHLASLVVSFAFGWFVGTVVTFIGPYLKELGLSKVGLYFAGFAVASVGVRLLAASALDSQPVRRLVVCSGTVLALSGLCLGLLKSYPSEALLLLASVLNGVGHGFLFPGLSAYVVRNSSEEQRGGGLALFTGVFDLGILSGALVSGYMSELNGYANTFTLACLLIFLSLPAFLVLDTKRNSR